MKEPFAEIREQLREIRNFCGPFELKLNELQEQIADIRASLKSASSTDALIGDLDRQYLDLMGRVVRIEQALEAPPRQQAAAASPAPAHEDKGGSNGSATGIPVPGHQPPQKTDG